MTRRSRRELEKAVDDLAEDAAGDDTDGVVFGVTAPWVEYDDGADEDGDVTANYRTVMRREDAEREGREILGPAKAPGDLVRVEDADTTPD